jgi:hypothetical protein
MRMTLWIAALLPITAALFWESQPFIRRTRRAIPPWLQIVCFAWMAAIFVLMPWLT